MIDLILTPEINALCNGSDNELNVLVQARPKEDFKFSKKRKDLNLAIVIDRSGSMSGQPLEEAKKSAIMLVEKMSQTDRVSIIAYDWSSEIIVPSTLCHNKRFIIGEISGILAQGSTDLHGGWLLGAEEVAKYKNNKSINRVLLLSDGNANHGVCNTFEIFRQVDKLSETGISTSTYGLGHHFNEELMIGMANNGKGQGYYGETAEDLIDPFEEEFELLANTIATNLKLKVKIPHFVNLKSMNQLNGTYLNWSIPDLALGGEGWALFKLSVKKEFIKDKPMEVLSCMLEYKNIEGDKHSTEDHKLILEPLKPSAFSEMESDEKVNSRVLEVTIANYQREARGAALRGEWHRVDSIIGHAKDIGDDHEWLRQNIMAIEKYAKKRQTQQFAKETYYSAEKLDKRLASYDEAVNDYSMDDEIAKPSFLRRKLERGKRMY